MEGFRSSYRRLRLDAETSAPPNPYAQALRTYQHARETGLKILGIGGGIVVLLAVVAIFWGGRASVGSSNPEPPITVVTPALAIAAKESIDAATIAISQNNANLATQLDEANRDRSHLQAVLDQTRAQAEQETDALQASLDEIRDLASIWVDHAQASLRMQHDRLRKLRDHRLTHIDPYLHQLLDRSSTDTEVSLRQYIELLTLETESTELDAISDLRRRCLKQVSGSNLERADLPSLLKDLRETYTRLARAEAVLEAGDERAEFFAQTLIDPDASGLETPREMLGTDSVWFRPKDEAQAMVKAWIAEGGPLDYLTHEAETGGSYRRLLRKFDEVRVSLAVPYDGGLVVVPTLDFATWLNFRRRLGGHSRDRALIVNFKEYYQFAYAIPHLRDLDLFVSARETFEAIEAR